MAGGLEGDNWGGIEDLHHKTLGAGNIRTWLVYKFSKADADGRMLFTSKAGHVQHFQDIWLVKSANDGWLVMVKA